VSAAKQKKQPRPIEEQWRAFFDQCIKPTGASAAAEQSARFTFYAGAIALLRVFDGEGKIDEASEELEEFLKGEALRNRPI
jgi:hypothetical protein